MKELISLARQSIIRLRYAIYEMNNYVLNQLATNVETNFLEALPLCNAIKNGKVCKFGIHCVYRHNVRKAKNILNLCRYKDNCKYLELGTCEYWHPIEINQTNWYGISIQ